MKKFRTITMLGLLIFSFNAQAVEGQLSVSESEKRDLEYTENRVKKFEDFVSDFDLSNINEDNITSLLSLNAFVMSDNFVAKNFRKSLSVQQMIRYKNLKNYVVDKVYPLNKIPEILRMTIEESRELVETNNSSYSVYEDEVRYCFNLAEFYRTPEMIKMLVGYLDDRYGEKGFGENMTQVFKNRSNAMRAVETLYRMPIVNPATTLQIKAAIIKYETDPKMQKVYSEEQYMEGLYLAFDRVEMIKAWQHWWKEVKAGKRFIQFEGDDRKYNAKGELVKD